jgi:hypothetical protein
LKRWRDVGRIATYLMLAGPLGAGVILVVGSWNYSRATRRIDALARDCEGAQRPFLHGLHDVAQQCDPASLQNRKTADPTITYEEIRASSSFDWYGLQIGL